MIDPRKAIHEAASSFFDTYLWREEILSGIDRTDPFWMLKAPLGYYPSFRQQIVAPAGIGKTTAVIKQLKRCAGKVVWFTVPTIKLAKELKDDIHDALGPCAIVVEGRSEENCKRYAATKALGKNGIPVQSTICKKETQLCEHYEICAYQAVREEVKALQENKNSSLPVIYIMVHQYLTLPCYAPKPDLVIVDESHWRVFIDKFAVKFHDLKKLSVDTQHAQYFQDTLALLKAGFVNPKTPAFSYLHKKQADYDLQPCIDHLDITLKTYEQIDINPSDTDQTIHSTIEVWPVPKIKRFIQLFEHLQQELNWGRKDSQTVTYDAQKKELVVHNLKPPIIDATIPMLLIDASADVKINRCLWGKHLNEVVIKAERKGHFVQIRKSFSKFSLGANVDKAKWTDDQKNLRQTTVAVINKLGGSYSGKTFLATSLAVLNSICSELDDHIRCKHYNSIRGSNEDEDCILGILLGGELPPASDVESIVRCLFSTSNKTFFSPGDYQKKDVTYQLRHGFKETGKVWMHIDPFCQRILRQIRECEMEQALDRLRLIYPDEDKVIIILSDVPLDLEVDRLWKWPEFLLGGPRLHRAVEQIIGQARAFPLTYTEWHRLFPEIWQTPNAAKGNLRNRGIKWVKSQLLYLMGNDPLSVVEYRRPGQHGKPSKAVISAREADPKNALETVVGEVKGDLKVIKIIK